MGCLLSPPPHTGGDVHDLPVSRLRALLRDFTTLLGQQMYLWGRDVIHPEGNLLCMNGFEKRKSDGLEGTSCYRKILHDDTYVELHGACAGCYEPPGSATPNFLYIRNRKHCFLYSGDEPPAPGIYARDSLHGGPALDLYFASRRFLDWWLEYEKWIAENTATGWRERGYTAFASLPASRPSLPPQEGTRWLRQYAHNPARITRVKEWARESKRH